MQDPDFHINKPYPRAVLITASIVIAALLLGLGAWAIINWSQSAPVEQASPTRNALAPVHTATPRIPVGEPAYIKELSASDEGYKGIAIYFVLADTNGQEIAAAGDATLEIFDGNGRTVLSRTGTVALGAFVYYTIGAGKLARRALLCSFGRLGYDQFDAQPTHQQGQVRLTFTTATGAHLVRTRDVLFDQ